MNCLHQSLRQTLDHGYAHHIQRLMVTGLYACSWRWNPGRFIRGTSPYVDAVEWVELPNTLGMSQYADGGFLASKPYAARALYPADEQLLRRVPISSRRRRPGRMPVPSRLFIGISWSASERWLANPRMVLQVKNLPGLPRRIGQRSGETGGGDLARTGSSTGGRPRRDFESSEDSFEWSCCRRFWPVLLRVWKPSL